MENNKKKLFPKSKGKSIMITGFVGPCHGFMSATINNEIINSYKLFYAGTHRDDWFTNNEDLIKQIDKCANFLMLMHPHFEILVAFDNSMTCRSHAPDELDALSSNLNLGDEDGWYGI